MRRDAQCGTRTMLGLGHSGGLGGYSFPMGQNELVFHSKILHWSINICLRNRASAVLQLHVACWKQQQGECWRDSCFASECRTLL